MKAISVLLGALLWMGCAAKGQHLGPHFLPLGPASESGDGIFARQGVELRARELLDVERAELLRKQTGSAVDPLALRKEGQRFFRTFQLDVVNRSRNEIYVNASFVSLQVQGERRFPLGYTQLYGLLRGAYGDEAIAARLAPLVDETSVAVPAGSQVRKLLVFDGVEADAREATLDILSIQSGEDSFSARLFFARPKVP